MIDKIQGTHSVKAADAAIDSATGDVNGEG